MENTLFKLIIRGISKIKIDKPPGNIFGLFVKENYQRIKLESTSANLKKLSEHYRNLSNDEIQQLREKLEIKLKEYDNLINIESQTNIKEIVKFGDQNGLPKKVPMSGFNLFMLEYFSSSKNKSIKLTQKEQFSAAAAAWKNLSENETKVYKDRCLEMKTEYDNSLKEWSEKHGVPFSNNRLKLSFYLYCKKKISTEC